MATSNAESSSLVSARVIWAGSGEQRVYYLSHDSIENFLHQNGKNLTAGGNFLGWLGVLVTIMLTLNTATFSAGIGLSADTLKSAFVLGAAGAAIGAIVEGWRWVKYRASPEVLATQLGERGIRPADLARIS